MMRELHQPLEVTPVEAKKFRTMEERWTDLQRNSRDLLKALPDLFLPLLHHILAANVDAADSITSHQPQVTIAQKLGLGKVVSRCT